MKTLAEKLISERKAKYQGGIYHRMQIDFAYNSNHIEGNHLSHDQTRYIYETKTIETQSVPVNDIIEMVNHFRCFDFIFNTLGESLTEKYIKKLHGILIMLKQCLENNIVPFIIGEDHKMFYYMRLREWQTAQNFHAGIFLINSAIKGGYLYD